MTSSSAPDASTHCPNCGAALQGAWCHECGQKRITRDERRFRSVLAEFGAAATSFDGKFIRSLIALVFQPGRLGEEWLAGRRTRWVSPVSLFVLVNVLFFIAPPTTDFNLPLIDQIWSQPYSSWAVDRVDVRVPGTKEWLGASGGLGPPEGFSAYESAFNRRTDSLSKSLLILQAPLMGLALLLLHLRRRIYFVDHFAIALHFCAFLLFALILVTQLFELSKGWFAHEAQAESFWTRTVLLLIFSSLVLMLRRAYGQSLTMAFFKALPVLAVCGLSNVLYRWALFAATHYSL